MADFDPVTGMPVGFQNPFIKEQQDPTWPPPDFTPQPYVPQALPWEVPPQGLGVAPLEAPAVPSGVQPVAPPQSLPPELTSLSSGGSYSIKPGNNDPVAKAKAEQFDVEQQKQMDAQQAAMDEQARIAKENADLEAKAIESQQPGLDAQAGIQQELADKLAYHQGEYDKVDFALRSQAEQLMAEGAKPIQSAWANQSKGQKAAALASAVIGGLLGVREGGKNLALDRLMAWAEEDAREQEQDRQRALSAGRMVNEQRVENRLQFGDFKESLKAQTAQRLFAVAADMKAKAAQYEAPQARLEGDKQSAQIYQAGSKLLFDELDTRQKAALAWKDQKDSLAVAWHNAQSTRMNAETNAREAAARASDAAQAAQPDMFTESSGMGIYDKEGNRVSDVPIVGENPGVRRDRRNQAAEAANNGREALDALEEYEATMDAIHRGTFVGANPKAELEAKFETVVQSLKKGNTGLNSDKDADRLRAQAGGGQGWIKVESAKTAKGIISDLRKKVQDTTEKKLRTILGREDIGFKPAPLSAERRARLANDAAAPQQGLNASSVVDTYLSQLSPKPEGEVQLTRESAIAATHNLVNSVIHGNPTKSQVERAKEYIMRANIPQKLMETSLADMDNVLKRTSEAKRVDK